jgi:hypothetical protein
VERGGEAERCIRLTAVVEVRRRKASDGRRLITRLLLLLYQKIPKMLLVPDMNLFIQFAVVKKV